MKRDHKEDARLREEAKNCFLLAAAALTQLPSAENVGFAALNGAVALLRLAQSDPQNKGLEVALMKLEAMKEDYDADAKAKAGKEH